MTDDGAELPSGLIARGISKTIRRLPILRDVNLDLNRGEIVGILGPNGAGKTSAFYAIAGMMILDSGEITIDGQDVSRFPMYRRSRLGLGYLPQEVSVFRGLSVEDNIRAILEIRVRDSDQREVELNGLLHEFSLTHLRKTRAVSLSGGERRRVEIARCLASRPNYILLDEPFAGIDPIVVGDIRSLVLKLKMYNIGVLITDHNILEVLALVDRAYVMFGGSILTEGTPGEIENSDNVRRIYLGDGYVGASHHSGSSSKGRRPGERLAGRPE